MGAAYAIQTTATTLTSYGATFSNTKTHHESILAIFTASKSATGSNTLLSVSPTMLSQSGSGSTQTQWQAETKTTTTWTKETI